ncbi:TRAP transporter large permease [Cuneatibacter sp. NSJ-177]|uniref:TRAP transporter large permease n=1 Tax=Cuneatibacter sp. NSJ-177 TaxID=2931401 RepID=UPI001FD072CE|nr:TRAP transporter large permease [Cuneatibacter sp. NSJ-177]MCJ7835096.1 TRAP transporter large permease [Cuneatibacter sp. NSJ-177]
MLGVIFGAMAVMLVLTVPIGVMLLAVALIPSLMDPGFTATVPFVLRNVVGGLNSTPLLAIPLFILGGIIMAQSGIAKKLFDVFAYLIGDKTGGMPCASIITCLFYGAISGSAPATTAAVGTMTIPILDDMGYDHAFNASTVAIAGGLGVIIPPSVPFIVYSMASGASVGDMFLAGVIPGILIALCLMIYAVYYCKTKGEDKERIRNRVAVLREKGFLGVLKSSFWALLSPIIILGGIYGGIVTPTEAALIGVFYAALVGLFIYRTLRPKDLILLCVEAVKTTAPMLLVIGAASAFSRVLSLMQASEVVFSLAGGLLENRIVLLFVLNLFLLFMGMIIDTSPNILIFTPVMLPLVQAVGVDPVHFGIIMVVNLAIGFVTPPVGVNLYVAQSLSGVPVITLAKKALPYIVMFFIALMLITYIPAISLMLL